MSSPVPALALEAYRALVSLDTPFTPPSPAPPEEHPTLLRDLGEQLRLDGTEARLREELGARASHAMDARAWLRALLTVRRPSHAVPAVEGLSS
ncbi:hypothetical protein OV208_09765 [Corallococcus sp. bb12-1]|uniref:hypothetical protein n=1 Tax=Corallococcus sp. bb12-1 TaxID=2996784 RepID=UPI002271DA3A|nr:hypothetical protein [Corallococcus sp. bb12-1]MCY1041600.1 hypothetical protein [Corallococcus sp. bb12-1]